MENQDPLTSEVQKKIHQQKVKIWMFALFVGIANILVFSYFLILKGTVSISSPISSDILKNVIPTPTPFPFRELTIPYLREREYKSNLGELILSHETTNYTAYLTNFDSDGLRVNGLLTKPKGEQPEGGFPAIIFVHGYIPPSQYNTREDYASYVDFLARNGFVVFKIDLRGHADSEGEAGGGYYSSDYIIDTLNAYAALQSSGFVKKDAIGLWGHSMAGNVIMRSMAAKPEIAGVAIWSGAVYTYEDQRKYGINDSSFQRSQLPTQALNRRQRLFEEVGSPSATSEFWQQVVPINYLKDLKGAIQVHHALDDNVVNIGYSRDLMELLDATSVPHALFEYSSGGHNITGISFTQAMQRTVDFFKESL